MVDDSLTQACAIVGAEILSFEASKSTTPDTNSSAGTADKGQQQKAAKPAVTETAKGDAPAKETEIVTRFDEDELYDDSGWMSMAPQRRTVAKKPEAHESAPREVVEYYNPATEYAGPVEYVIPWTEPVFVLPWNVSLPVYIYP